MMVRMARNSRGTAALGCPVERSSMVLLLTATNLIHHQPPKYLDVSRQLSRMSSLLQPVSEKFPEEVRT